VSTIKPRDSNISKGSKIINEKDFRDRGSGFVVMRTFVDRHKKYIEWWMKKLKISNYGIVWIAFVKGLIIGLLIYHFFIN